MRITIHVKTKSGRSEIVKEKDKYIAYLKAIPKNGKANLELLKIARKSFGRETRIVSGKTSKIKVIEY